MKNALTIFAFVLLVLSPFAQAQYNQVSYQVVTLLKEPKPDNVLRYGDSELQFVEHWQSPSQSKKNVVFVHGGCWLSAYDIAHSRAVTGAIRDEGFEVFSIEYRRAGDPDGGWPNSLTDINSAVTYLSEQGYIEPQNTVIMGHSAGGHLAILSGIAKPKQFNGIVGLAAITDIKKYAKGSNGCQRATTSFMQGTPEEKPQAYQEANPVDNEIPINTWLMYADRDTIVPDTHASAVKQERRVLIKGGGHFDFVHPNTVAFEQMMLLLNTLY